MNFGNMGMGMGMQQSHGADGGINQQANLGGMKIDQSVGPNGEINQSIDFSNLPPPKEGEPGYGQQNPGKIDMNFGGF